LEYSAQVGGGQRWGQRGRGEGHRTHAGPVKEVKAFGLFLFSIINFIIFTISIIVIASSS
jgi:hypothetical protein